MNAISYFEYYGNDGRLAWWARDNNSMPPFGSTLNIIVKIGHDLLDTDTDFEIIGSCIINSYEQYPNSKLLSMNLTITHIIPPYIDRPFKITGIAYHENNNIFLRGHTYNSLILEL